MNTTPIKLWNTLSGSKETFNPITPGAVTMYNCGPTVYDTPHIGNYRTFVLNDILRRVFAYNGYSITHAMNITDVDDKTIKKSRAENTDLKHVTKKYEDLFMEEIVSLGVIVPEHVTRATEYIPSMIDLIQTLIDKGYAYSSKDGVYMGIAKVKDYGLLAHLDPSHQHDTHRVSDGDRIVKDEYDKEDIRDFALWKFKTPEDGDTSWPAPFGEGRPGWHIECSAMSMNILGPTIDIHSGGSDLIFPHHTNEIAQSESATGKKFVNYWIHGGFMNFNNEKMAKSKGNFIKLNDLRENHISPLAYRYWLLTAHYRSQVNFTYEAVKAGQSAYNRLVSILAKYPTGGKTSAEYRAKFLDLINDDLDMPKAVALIWDLLKDLVVSDADKRATVLNFDQVLGLKIEKAMESELTSSMKPTDISAEIQSLVDARQAARASKDWKKADELRKSIESKGYEIKDTGDTTELFKK